jgi:DNA-binding YbaB/EbfC family protein
VSDQEGQGPFDLGAMMEQARSLQESMLKAQEEAKNHTVEASVGGGMVTVVLSGGLEVRSVKIDPAVINPNDKAMLEDLVAAAVNQAIQKAQALTNESLQKALGPLAGLQIPGLF